MWCIYTLKYLSAIKIKKKELLQFVTTWMDIEGIMVSKINHRRTNTILFHLQVESKKQHN